VDDYLDRKDGKRGREREIERENERKGEGERYEGGGEEERGCKKEWEAPKIVIALNG